MDGRAVLAERTIRLTYADTDAAAILYYAAWFPWMERMSVEWAFDAGFRFDQMLATHGAAPVTRATECEYLGRAVVYDLIHITMSVAAIGTTSYRLGYTMTRADGLVVARSSLTLVFVDASGTPVPVPAGLREPLTQPSIA